jgi:hypothetical protein
MNAPEIVGKAKAMGVRLALNGDRVKMRGPAEAVVAIKPEITAQKGEIIAYLRTLESETVPTDCVSALRDPDGGLYLPWGAYLSPDDVNRMRIELVKLIETVADAEEWEDRFRDDVLTRAIRGPLADLLPNLAHFRARARNDRRTT